MPTRYALGSLLSGVSASVTGDADTTVTGISYDSRRVTEGDVFVAVPGFVHDGSKFVPDAIAAGATAIVAQTPPPSTGLPASVRAWARVDDARAVLGPMSAAFYGRPSNEFEVIGVTGTNGKTTVTALLEAILSARGPSGRWSTTTVSVAGAPYPAHRTTPEGPDLQAVLRRMVDAGCWAAAIEVSSHALSLQRVDGTTFAAAVFTNLSDDHLDFHQDMDDYLAAKARLFERLDAGCFAVLNVGEPASATLAAGTKARVVGYGWKTRPASRDSIRAALEREARGADKGATSRGALNRTAAKLAIDVPTNWILDWGYLGTGSKLVLDTAAGELEFESPLFGKANAENLAAAITVALELGLSADEIAAPVAAFAGARGRFQRIDVGQPFAVLVDFAHTPAALEAALAASRDLAGAHRVIAVFGCGGDRDRGKRPKMGAIAAQMADQIVVTSDNPRTEDPAAIIAEIIDGISKETDTQLETEADRRVAIELALERARPGDCVLIAGKGHETEQIFADRTIPFDDTEIASRWLSARYDLPGHAAGDGAGS